MSLSPISLNAPAVILTPTTSNDSDNLSLGCRQVRIYNAGPSAAFVASSSAASTTASTTTSTCIPAGVVESFSIDMDHKSIAAICASGSATVYITCGPGI